MLDPTVFALALALTDNAIKGVSSVEQFYETEPLNTEKKFMFEWNEDVLDKPVFSRIDRCKGVLKDEAWNCNNMFYQLQDVSQCAGYRRGDINDHTFRRGFANAIESKSSRPRS